MANQHSGHSQEGKDIIRKNSLQHGILSTDLFLDDEDPKQFDDLLNMLSEELHPGSTIEDWLVHKLVMNIWRQIRLLKAEKASIELQRRLEIPKNQALLKEATGMVMPQSNDPSDGATSNMEKVAEHQSQQEPKANLDQLSLDFLAEYDRFSPLRNQLTDFGQIKQTAPKMAAQVVLVIHTLSDTPEEARQKLQDDFWYWADFIAGNLKSSASADASSSDLSANEENAPPPEPTVATDEIIKLVKAAYSAPFNLPLMGRYATMLNNEFYKTLNTFREEQEWRLKTIDASNHQSQST